METVVKHWNGVSRAVVESLFLEVFKRQIIMALRVLVVQKVKRMRLGKSDYSLCSMILNIFSNQMICENE